MDKPRTRIIDGRQFVQVADTFTMQGKYRPDKPHWERHDGKVWALVDDLKRLDIAGNRLKAKEN